MLTRGAVLLPREYRGETEPPDTLEDTSRYGNDGVHTDIAWVRLPSGLWGRDFDGATSVVTITAHPSLDLLNGISVIAWVYPRVWGDSAIVEKRSANDGALLSITSGNLGFNIRHAATSHWALIAGLPSVNNWHLVVGTWDKITVRTYNDTVIGGTTAAWATTRIPVINNQLIGRASFGTVKSLDGIIVKERILDYALSAAQIYKIFNSERSLFGV